MSPDHKNWIHPSLDLNFSKTQEQYKIEFVQAHVWMENIPTLSRGLFTWFLISILRETTAV